MKVLKLLFLLCLSKKSECPRYWLFMFVFCCQGFINGSTGVSIAHMHCQIKHISLAKQKYLHGPHIPLKINTNKVLKVIKLLLLCANTVSQCLKLWCFIRFVYIKPGPTPTPFIPHGGPMSLDTAQNCHSIYIDTEGCAFPCFFPSISHGTSFHCWMSVWGKKKCCCNHQKSREQ